VALVQTKLFEFADQPVRVGRHLPRQYLQRDAAMELRVLGDESSPISPWPIFSIRQQCSRRCPTSMVTGPLPPAALEVEVGQAAAEGLPALQFHTIQIVMTIILSRSR